MKVNDTELPESPLWTLRSVLGDVRVDDIGESALAVARECGSVDEIVCFAEHLRLFAGKAAWEEETRAEVLGDVGA